MPVIVDAVEVREIVPRGEDCGGSELFAKQIKHFPSKRGLWLDSRSLPHSI